MNPLECSANASDDVDLVTVSSEDVGKQGQAALGPQGAMPDDVNEGLRGSRLLRLGTNQRLDRVPSSFGITASHSRQNRAHDPRQPLVGQGHFEKRHGIPVVAQQPTRCKRRWGNHTPTTTGMYAANVSSIGTGVTGDYTFNVVPGSLGEECFAGPGSIGGTGKSYVVYPLGSSYTPRIIVTRPSACNSIVYQSSQTSGATATLDFTTAAAGTYVIVVTSHQYNATGRYTFVSTLTRAKSSPPLNDPMPIGYEPIVPSNRIVPFSKTTRSIGASLLLVAMICGGGQARAEEPRAVAVVMPSHAGSLSDDAVRSAIGKELNMKVHNAAAQDVVGTVVVTVQEDGEALIATLRFTRSTGEAISRSIALPPEPDRAVEAIALLAGNLVRDEAGALIASLTPVPEPPESVQPEPVSSEENVAAEAPERKVPKEPEEAATSAPRSAEREASDPVAEAWQPRDWSWVNLSLLHPVSLYPNAEENAVAVQLGLFFSRVGQLSGFGLDTVALHVDHDLHGFGFGSVYLGAEGNMDGFGLAGIVAGAGGEARGMQIGGIAAFADAVQGLQVGSVAVSGDVQGVQSGAVAVASEVEGVQAAAVTVSSELEGVQVGAVAVSGDVDGLQIGAVNVAGRVRGAQIGLVNVAREVDGVSIGLVNLGVRVQPTMWASTTTPLNAGVMYRASPGYTLLYGGWDPDGNHQQLGAALGVGVPLGILQLDADAGYAAEWDADLFGVVDRHVVRYRLTVGVQATSWLSLFAGGGLRQDVEEGSDEERYRPEFHGGLQLL